MAGGCGGGLSLGEGRAAGSRSGGQVRRAGQSHLNPAAIIAHEGHTQGAPRQGGSTGRGRRRGGNGSGVWRGVRGEGGGPLLRKDRGGDEIPPLNGGHIYHSCAKHNGTFRLKLDTGEVLSL